MSEQLPSVVAEVLAVAAVELGDLGATAAGVGDFVPRLRLARGLLEWASVQLTTDAGRFAELGQRVAEFASAGPGVTGRAALAATVEELLDVRGAGEERAEAAAEPDSLETSEAWSSADEVTDYLRRRRRSRSSAGPGKPGSWRPNRYGSSRTPTRSGARSS